MSSSSVATGLVAKKEKLEGEVGSSPVSFDDLFCYGGTGNVLVSCTGGVVEINKQIKFVKAGKGSIKAEIKEESISIEVVVSENSENIAKANTLLSRFSSYFYAYGQDGTSIESPRYVEFIKTEKYDYDAISGLGEALLSDNNVYKVRTRTDGSFFLTGSSLGSKQEWEKTRFPSFALSKKEIITETKENELYLTLPKFNFDGGVNLTLKSLLDSLTFDYSSTSFTYAYITPIEVAEDGFEQTYVYLYNDEGQVISYAEVAFGLTYAKLDAFLETASIPKETDKDEDALVNMVKRMQGLNNFRIFGADATDTDYERFYNLYSKTQYFETFMDESYGYANIDGKVYKYSKNDAGFADFGTSKTPVKITKTNEDGTKVEVDATDYNQIIPSLYSIDSSIFASALMDGDDYSLFEYSPSSDDGVLGEFLLQTVGYDLGSDNYLKNMEGIDFYIQEDALLVEIYLSFGEIKYQFDSFNSAELHTIVLGFDDSSYVGTYTGGFGDEKGTTLDLLANHTGTFFYMGKLYKLTWKGELDETNKNKVNFAFEITSGADNGEYFAGSYAYKTTKNAINSVQFHHLDENGKMKNSSFFMKTVSQ